VRKKRSLKIPTSLIPKPKTIVKRGIYEGITALTGGNVHHRNYGKRMTKGRY